jgi:uncharacterized membrane protein
LAAVLLVAVLAAVLQAAVLAAVLAEVLAVPEEMCRKEAPREAISHLLQARLAQGESGEEARSKGGQIGTSRRLTRGPP